MTSKALQEMTQEMTDAIELEIARCMKTIDEKIESIYGNKIMDCAHVSVLVQMIEDGNDDFFFNARHMAKAILYCYDKDDAVEFAELILDNLKHADEAKS